MLMFLWNENYSVHNEELDNQHMILFELLNTVLDCPPEDYTQEFHDTIIDELERYIDWHFSSEEKYMKSIGFRDLEQHIIQHKSFTAKVAEIKAGGLLQHDRMVDILGTWLKTHILQEDKKYAVA